MPSSKPDQRRSDEESSQRNRSQNDSVASGSSKRRSSKRDNPGREGGFQPISSSFSSSSRSPYAGVAAPSVASSHATATPTDRVDARIEPPLLERNDSMVDRVSRAVKKQDRKASLRDTEGTSRSVRGDDNGNDHDNPKRRDSAKRRDSKRSDKSRKDSSRALEDHNASLVQNQFPGEMPTSYAQPYRPPGGLAAEYYGDHGESVQFQPGVRPNPPSVIHTADQAHLIEPSLEAKPPPEPSSMGQVGAAASFYGNTSDTETTQMARHSHSVKKQSSKPSASSNSHARQGASPVPNGISPMQGQPAGSGIGSMGSAAMSAGVGLAAEYYTADIPITTPDMPVMGPQSSSSFQSYSQSQTHSNIDSQSHSQYHTGDNFSNGSTKPPRPSMFSASNAPLYGAAAAAGLVGAATLANHEGRHGNEYQQQAPQYQIGSQHVPGQTQSAFPVMQHRHQHRPRTVLGKFAEWWRDRQGVAQFEEYTEAIGVCRDCFDPNSSPLDAPRRHHYHGRRSSGSRHGSTTRVDKLNRYSSDEDRRRKSTMKKVVAGGIAAAGAAKVGEALYKQKNDFDDTYSVKSGIPPNRSRVSFRDDEEHYSERKNRHSESEEVRVTRSNSSRKSRRDSVKSEQRSNKRRDSSGSEAGLSRGAAMSAGVTTGLAVAGFAATESRRKRRSRSRSKSPSRRYYHRRISPRHSYVDLSATNPGITGFFASPSENKRKGKKSKGLFNFTNASSSSSDADLAFGEGTVRRKRSSRRDDGQNGRDDTAAIMGLAATGAALAAESSRREKKGKRNADLLVENGADLRRSKRVGSHDDTSDGMNDDAWEDAPDDDGSSIDSALAYGRRLSAKQSRESLAGEGTSKWAWRWNKNEKDRQRKKSSQHDQRRYDGEAAGAALTSWPPEFAIATPPSNLPPLQYLDPIPTSDSPDVRRASAMSGSSPGSSAPIVRTGQIPLQQPQPFTPVTAGVYDAQGFSRYPSGPTVFDNAPPATSWTESPKQISANVFEEGTERRRSSRKRRDSSPAALPFRESRDSVQFDLTDKRKGNEKRGERRIPRRDDQERHDSIEGKTESTPLISGGRADETPSKKSKNTSAEERSAREAEIERELERLYEESKQRALEEEQRKRGISTAGGAAAAITAGTVIVATAAGETTAHSDDEDVGRIKSARKKRRDTPDKRKDRDTSPRQTAQEYIAQKAAERVKSSPSPVHDDYQTFFVPPEIAQDLPEHNARAADRDDQEVAATNVVEVVSGGVKVRDIDNPELYLPFGQAPSHDPQKMPWPVPALKLREPTPPPSRTASIRDDNSPIILPKDVAEPIEDVPERKPKSRRSSVGSRVTWGDHDTYVYEVQTPEWERQTPDWERPSYHSTSDLSRVQTLEDVAVSTVPPVEEMTAAQREHLSKGGDFSDLTPSQTSVDQPNDTPEGHAVEGEAAPTVVEREPSAEREESDSNSVGFAKMIAAAAAGLSGSVLNVGVSRPETSSDLPQAGEHERASYQSPFDGVGPNAGSEAQLTDEPANGSGFVEEIPRTPQGARIPTPPPLPPPQAPRTSRSEARRQERAWSGPTTQSPTEPDAVTQGGFNVFDYLVEAKGNSAPTPSHIGRNVNIAAEAAEAARKRAGRAAALSALTRGQEPNAENEPEIPKPNRAMTLDLKQTEEASSSSRSKDGFNSDPENWETRSKKPKRSSTVKSKGSGMFEKAAMAMVAGTAGATADDFYEQKKAKKRSKRDIGTFDDDDDKSVSSSPATFQDSQEDKKAVHRSSKPDMGEIDDDPSSSPAARRQDKSSKQKSKEKEQEKKKSGGFFNSLFSSSRSDVSTSSKKSSKSAPVDDGEQKRKRNSRDRDGNTSSTDPARRSRSGSQSSVKSAPAQENSVEDGFVSTGDQQQTENEQSASFLAKRPEMRATPMDTEIVSCVSGLPEIRRTVDSSHAEGQSMAGLIIPVPLGEASEDTPPTDGQKVYSPSNAATTSKAADAETTTHPSNVSPKSEPRPRRLSSILTGGEVNSLITTASPTAVPLMWRRAPASPGVARSGSFGSPSSPMSPLTTPRTRQARPPSTEIRSREVRPLYLVEVHSSAKMPMTDVQEAYPSLPSSRTSSAHPSMENLRSEAEAEAETEDQYPLTQERLSPEQMRRQSYQYWHSERSKSPDYLDSGQVTPTAASPQLLKKEKPKYEFHSPSELLQDPSLHQDTATEERDTVLLASPLPSVVSSGRDEQDEYMSARSGSRSTSPGLELASSRSRSPSRRGDREADKGYWRGVAVGVLGAVAAATGLNALADGSGSNQERHEDQVLQMPSAQDSVDTAETSDRSMVEKQQDPGWTDAQEIPSESPHDLANAAGKPQTIEKEAQDLMAEGTEAPLRSLPSKKSMKDKNKKAKRTDSGLLVQAQSEAAIQSADDLPVLTTSTTAVREPTDAREIAQPPSPLGPTPAALPADEPLSTIAGAFAVEASPIPVLEIPAETAAVAAELRSRKQSIAEQPAETGDLTDLDSVRKAIEEMDETAIVDVMDDTDIMTTLSERASRTSFPFSGAGTAMPLAREMTEDPATQEQMPPEVTVTREESFVPTLAQIDEPANDLTAFEEAFERARRSRGLVEGVTRDDAVDAFLPERNNAPFIQRGVLTPITDMSTHTTPQNSVTPTPRQSGDIVPLTDETSTSELGDQQLDAFSSTTKKSKKEERKGKKGKSKKTNKLSDPIVEEEETQTSVNDPETREPASSDPSPLAQDDANLSAAIAASSAAAALLAKNAVDQSMSLGGDSAVEENDSATATSDKVTRAQDASFDSGLNDKNPFGDDFEVKLEDQTPAMEQKPASGSVDKSGEEDTAWEPPSKKDKKKKKKSAKESGFPTTGTEVDAPIEPGSATEEPRPATAETYAATVETPGVPTEESAWQPMSKREKKSKKGKKNSKTVDWFDEQTPEIAATDTPQPETVTESETVDEPQGIPEAIEESRKELGIQPVDELIGDEPKDIAEAIHASHAELEIQSIEGPLDSGSLATAEQIREVPTSQNAPYQEPETPLELADDPTDFRPNEPVSLSKKKGKKDKKSGKKGKAFEWDDAAVATAETAGAVAAAATTSRESKLEPEMEPNIEWAMPRKSSKKDKKKDKLSKRDSTAPPDDVEDIETTMEPAGAANDKPSQVVEAFGADAQEQASTAVGWTTLQAATDEVQAREDPGIHDYSHDAAHLEWLDDAQTIGASFPAKPATGSGARTGVRDVEDPAEPVDATSVSEVADAAVTSTSETMKPFSSTMALEEAPAFSDERAEDILGRLDAPVDLVRNLSDQPIVEAEPEPEDSAFISKKKKDKKQKRKLPVAEEQVSADPEPSSSLTEMHDPSSSAALATDTTQLDQPLLDVPGHRVNTSAPDTNDVASNEAEPDVEDEWAFPVKKNKKEKKGKKRQSTIDASAPRHQIVADMMAAMDDETQSTPLTTEAPTPAESVEQTLTDQTQEATKMKSDEVARDVQDASIPAVTPQEPTEPEEWGFTTKKKKKDKKMKRQSTVPDVDALLAEADVNASEETAADSTPANHPVGKDVVEATEESARDLVEQSKTSTDQQTADTGTEAAQEDEWNVLTKKGKKDKKKKRQSTTDIDTLLAAPTADILGDVANPFVGIVEPTSAAALESVQVAPSEVEPPKVSVQADADVDAENEWAMPTKKGKKGKRNAAQSTAETDAPLNKPAADDTELAATEEADEDRLIVQEPSEVALPALEETEQFSVESYIAPPQVDPVHGEEPRPNQGVAPVSSALEPPSSIAEAAPFIASTEEPAADGGWAFSTKSSKKDKKKKRQSILEDSASASASGLGTPSEAVPPSLSVVAPEAHGISTRDIEEDEPVPEPETPSGAQRVSVYLDRPGPPTPAEADLAFQTKKSKKDKKKKKTKFALHDDMELEEAGLATPDPDRELSEQIVGPEAKAGSPADATLSDRQGQALNKHEEEAELLYEATSYDHDAPHLGWLNHAERVATQFPPRPMAAEIEARPPIEPEASSEPMQETKLVFEPEIESVLNVPAQSEGVETPAAADRELERSGEADLTESVVDRGDLYPDPEQSTGAKEEEEASLFEQSQAQVVDPLSIEGAGTVAVPPASIDVGPTSVTYRAAAETGMDTEQLGEARSKDDTEFGAEDYALPSKKNKTDKRKKRDSAVVVATKPMQETPHAWPTVEAATVLQPETILDESWQVDKPAGFDDPQDVTAARQKPLTEDVVNEPLDEWAFSTKKAKKDKKKKRMSVPGGFEDSSSGIATPVIQETIPEPAVDESKEAEDVFTSKLEGSEQADDSFAGGPTATSADLPEEWSVGKKSKKDKKEKRQSGFDDFVEPTLSVTTMPAEERLVDEPEEVVPSTETGDTETRDIDTVEPESIPVDEPEEWSLSRKKPKKEKKKKKRTSTFDDLEDSTQTSTPAEWVEMVKQPEASTGPAEPEDTALDRAMESVTAADTGVVAHDEAGDPEAISLGRKKSKKDKKKKHTLTFDDFEDSTRTGTPAEPVEMVQLPQTGVDPAVMEGTVEDHAGEDQIARDRVMEDVPAVDNEVLARDASGGPEESSFGRKNSKKDKKKQRQATLDDVTNIPSLPPTPAETVEEPAMSEQKEVSERVQDESRELNEDPFEATGRKKSKKDKKKKKTLMPWGEEPEELSTDQLSEGSTPAGIDLPPGQGASAMDRGRDIINALSFDDAAAEKPNDEDISTDSMIENPKMAADEQPVQRDRTSTYENLEPYDLQNKTSNPKRGRGESMVAPGEFGEDAEAVAQSKSQDLESEKMGTEPDWSGHYSHNQAHLDWLEHAKSKADAFPGRPDYRSQARETTDVASEEMRDVPPEVEEDWGVSRKKSKKGKKDKVKKGRKSEPFAWEEAVSSTPSQDVDTPDINTSESTAHILQPVVVRREASTMEEARPDSPESAYSSSRERRRRRLQRSSGNQAGEEPEDLPSTRALTPPADHDNMMDTALAVAAGLGLTGTTTATVPSQADEFRSERPRDTLDQPRAVEKLADAPGWSFANLGTQEDNRDSGIHFADSPIAPHTTLDPIRDSGYVPSPMDRSSWHETSPHRARRPDSPTSSAEDVRELPDIHHPTAGGILATPAKRQPSPVDPATKDRSSALFDSSPLTRPGHEPMRKLDTTHIPPPATDIHRSPSIHGHHRSREKLRASSPGRGSSSDRTPAHPSAGLSNATHQPPLFSPHQSRDYDHPFSPPRTPLQTIHEATTNQPQHRSRQLSDSGSQDRHPGSVHHEESGRDASSERVVSNSAGMGAPAAITDPRDNQPSRAKSLGKNKPRTSTSGHSLRDQFGYNKAVASSSRGVDDAAEGSARNMAGVFDGYGERPASPMSPTRPPSVRRRQSTQQIKELETRLALVESEKQALEDSHHERSQSDFANQDALQVATAQLREKDEDILKLREGLVSLQEEVARLTEVNRELTTAHETLDTDHESRYRELQSQHEEVHGSWQESTRELETLRGQHNELSTGMDDIVRHEIDAALRDKNAEIDRLEADLEDARERIKELQSEILNTSHDDVVVVHDEDYFDNACQQLCQHVQQWVLRFSKFSDTRVCRTTNEVRDEEVVDRFDNAILDGSDVDDYLSDRVKRRDVFMSVVMTMIWKYIFTRYLFGLDREQRQKLKNLEKNLQEVGQPTAVRQWRALTLTLLCKRETFMQQRESDNEAVVIEIFSTLAKFLPPPGNLEKQIRDSLRNVIRAAADLSVEMRCQRAEYVMLPPLQPEYDTNGDLASKVYFKASLMNERSGETRSNDDLEAEGAVVRMVLFPLVVKKGDDSGAGDDEIVVCPAQVLVARERESLKRAQSRMSTSGGAVGRVLSAEHPGLRRASRGSASAMSLHSNGHAPGARSPSSAVETGEGNMI